MEDFVLSSYQDAETAAKESRSPDSWSETDMHTWLLEQVSDIAPRAKVNPAVDLFQQGFDSLYAASLRLRIVNVLYRSQNPKHHEVAKSLSQNLIYSFPVINDLAAFISSRLNSPNDLQSNIASRDALAMETMINKYSSGFDFPLPPSPKTNVPSPLVVLLTGSTGNLGSQILAKLLKDVRVEKVYAYNRPSQNGTKTMFQRHLEKFEEVELDVTLLKSGKLTFISGDAAKLDLGLVRDLYSLLSQTVNVVIHNAWRLDFNISLESYEPNIQGIRHLVDLIRSGPRPLDARFLFVSSIGAVQNWDRSKGLVPEDAFEDVSVALGGGYGEAKHVAERILHKSGLQTLVFRVGQIIGGPPRGVWPASAIPLASGLASWLYAETISAAIVDLALSKLSTPLPRALNLVHPRPVLQSDITRSIAKAVANILGHDLKLVPFRQWLSILEKLAEDATVGETWVDIVRTFSNSKWANEKTFFQPAIKLLEFFRRYANAEADDSATQSEAGGLPRLSTEKVQRISQFMRSENLQQIGDNDAMLWVSYWQSIGFIN
ncbi:hypothetical protein C0993_011566 [Termitomyces sp. T159_Od127]|nr:hypothetical protein C0993_011566 [Termitomyces sp. T159_Od127]